MNEEIYYNGEEIRNANNDSKETESSISEGIGEVTAINSDLNAFWTDENGKKMVEELANQIKDSEDFNEDYTKYLQVMLEASETLGEKGEQIRLDLSKAKDISNAIEIVGDNIQNARESLNNAATSAKEFSGAISSIATNITKTLYLLATIDKDITKIFADLAENENIVEPKLNNILANMRVDQNKPVIDFNKVSTSIDNSKNGIFVNVNDKQRENYWKDCTLEETKEPGVYRASKDGVILGFVQLTEAGTDYEYVKYNESNEEKVEQAENTVVESPVEEESQDEGTVIGISQTENRMAEEEKEKGLNKNLQQKKLEEDKKIADNITKVVDGPQTEEMRKGLATRETVSQNSTGASINQVANQYNLTPDQMEVVYATILHEAGPQNGQVEVEAVTSAIYNRMNDPKWNVSDPYSAVTAKKQFNSYGAGYYKQYLNNVDEETKQTINNILSGNKEPIHNYESFRSSGSTSYSNNTFTSGGNRYK